jgi:hypothetical protein
MTNTHVYTLVGREQSNPKHPSRQEFAMKRRGTRVTTALIIGLTTVIPVSMMDSSLAPSSLHLASKI